MDKTLIIIKREYLSVVRKKSFWLGTIILPVFIVLISLVSGFTSKNAEDKVTKIKTEDGIKILVLDESELVDTSLIKDPFYNAEDYASAKQAILDDEADIFIFIPNNVLSQDSKIEVFDGVESSNIISNYQNLGKQLLQKSFENRLSEEDKKVYQLNFKTDLLLLKDGQFTKPELTAFIPSIMAISLYFVLLIFSSSFLLQSLSEEKESRMMEILLSVVKPWQLIAGKLIGTLLIVFTQVGLLIAFAIGALSVGSSNLPFDVSDITVNIPQMILSFTYAVLGFFVLASIMVGVGAAFPTQKEAQSFSAIFSIMAMAPIYFFMAVISEPYGFVAKVTSYIPVTAPMVLLIRNALESLSTFEIIVSIIWLIIQGLVAFLIAYWLFKLGALEYNSKINLKKITTKLKHFNK